MADLEITGRVTVNAEQAEGAFAKVGAGADKMAKSVEGSAGKAGKAVDGIGAGAAKGAEQFTRAEARIRDSIKRSTDQINTFGKTASEKLQIKIDTQGLDSAKFAPYIAELKRAEEATRDLSQANTNAGDSFSSMRQSMTTLGIGVAIAGIGTALRYVAAESSKAQMEQAQLSAVLKSTGESAGYAQGELNKMASALSGKSIFAAGDITEAQTRLLAYTGIVGEQFPRAMQNVIDMAQRMGMDVKSSAETIGRALDIPSEGLTALTRQGFRFTEAQKAMVTELEATGRAGEAQAIIMDALESSYGGAAEAAQGTLGGAMKSLSNSVNDLVMTLAGSTGAADSMTESITRLSAGIRSLDKDAQRMASSNGLADWFFLAFNNEKSLNSELEITQKQLNKLEARLANQPNNIYTKAAVADMRAYVAEIKEAQSRLAALTGDSAVLNSENYGNEGSREASRQREIERKSRLGNDLNAFRLKRDGVPANYVKDMAEIIRLNQAGVLVGKEYTDALKQQQDALEGKAAATKKAGGAAKKAGDEYAFERDNAKQWADAYKGFTDIAARAQASTDGLSEAQRRLAEFLKSPAYANASVPMQQLIVAQAEAAIEAEKTAEAFKRQQAAVEALMLAEEQRIVAQQRATLGVENQLQRLLDEEQAMELAAAANISLAVAIEEVTIARLREAQAKEMSKGSGMNDSVVLEIQREIDARQKLKDAIGRKDQREAVKKQAEDAAKEWEKMTDQVGQALTDALMRGFESGKSFGKNFTDSLVNSFKTIVARELQNALTGAIRNAFAQNGNGAGQGGGNMISSLGSAYSSFSTGLGGGAGGGAGAVGGNASAIGSFAGGSMSYANAAGSIYANATGTGISGLLATNGAYGTAAGASGAAAGSAGGMTALSATGWGALIVAAIYVANGLYKSGWNRDALGKGEGQSVRFGMYSNYNSDPKMGNSMAYNIGVENVNRQVGQMIGISDKWNDMLSGTVRMAALFGRKLKEVGLVANIAGGEVTGVEGYAKYKGGLFRSNKTVAAEVDPRDTEMFRAQTESFVEGTKNMARAMGYSDEAINSYTGSLKVNFKGVKSNEEAAERMAKAMDDMQFAMIKAASGTKLSREEFTRFMEGIKQDIQAAGISEAGITDIMAQGLMNGSSGEEIGAALADNIIGGIYNTLAQNAFAPVSAAIMQQIITPMFTAMAAGIPLAEALNEAALKNVVEMANNAAAMLNELFNNEAFKGAMANLGKAFNSIGGSVASVKVPNFGSRGRGAGGAPKKDVAAERYQLETQLLNQLGNINKLRERELNALDASNRPLQMRIWAIEDARKAMDYAMEAVRRSIEKQRETLNKELDSARDIEASLNDVFGILRDNIRELKGEVLSTTVMQADQARQVIRQALVSGILPKADDLQRAIDAARSGIDADNYSTALQQNRATLKLAAELSALKDVAQPQLSAAEQQVALLEEHLETLDVQLQVAEDQMNALLGIDTSVKSVADAITFLNTAMAEYSAAIARGFEVVVASAPPPQSSGGGGGGGGYGGGGYSAPKTPAPAAVWTPDGYFAKNQDLQVEYAAIRAADPKEKNKQFTQNPEMSYRDEYLLWHWNTFGQKENRRYAKGGYYPGGMALVGEQGPELINFDKPGQVYTAAQTQNLMGGSDKALLVEIKGLRDDLRVQSRSSVMIQSRQVKIVERWDNGGLPQPRMELA